MRAAVLVRQEKQGKGLAYVEPFHKAVRKIPGVVDSYPVLGRFDDVVFLEAKDYDALLDVSHRVANVPGVKSAETLPEGP